MTKTACLIINADDFGASDSINAAVSQSIERGLVSSTTILANGAAFEEACQIVRDHKLNDRVGIHLNLTQGAPLTEDIRKCPRFCSGDGDFIRERSLIGSLLRPFSAEERSALSKELSAQIARCRQQGLVLTHADSHHHKHTEWNVGALVMEVLSEERIKYLRPIQNTKGAKILKKPYISRYNRVLNEKNLMGVDYFSHFDDCESLRGSSASIEVMCHPRTVEGESIIDLDGRDLAAEIPRLREKFIGFDILSYGSLERCDFKQNR